MGEGVVLQTDVYGGDMVEIREEGLTISEIGRAALPDGGVLTTPISVTQDGTEWLYDLFRVECQVQRCAPTVEMNASCLGELGAVPLMGVIGIIRALM